MYWSTSRYRKRSKQTLPGRSVPASRSWSATTGLTDAHQAAIDGAAGHIAVIRTGNTSLGVAMLGVLVREAAARLGEDWDIEILEMHHRMKVDAPSGTALMLGRAAASGRGRKFEELQTLPREGLTGPRKPGSIGVASLRGGDRGRRAFGNLRRQ